MDDQEIADEAAAYLALRGMSLEALTPRRREKFLEVVGAVMKRQRALEGARAALKGSRISIHTISADTGISNKTFYSNDLLHDYVESHATRDEENVILSRKKLDSLERQKADLSEQVALMVRRDDESERLRTEVDVLRDEIKQRDERIGSLEKELERTRIQLVKASGGRHGKVISVEAFR